MRLSRCCVRMFSSLPQGSMHLKSVMRRVAKRVHPDLFSDCPAEQAVNQKSLALLNEWLSLAATGSEPHGRSYAYNFEFYVRPEAEEEVGNTEAGRPAPLHHVTLSLPPPGRRLHAHGDRSSLSPAAAAALRKLLDALGVQEQLMDVSSDESSYSAGLLDILPDATEALRQAESSARSAEDVIRMARAALRMKRNIMVSFAQGAPADAARRAQLAQQLAVALDATPDGFMRGCAIVLGNKFGSDPGSGSIWLDCRTDAAIASWTQRLLTMDVVGALAAKESAAARRDAEQLLASRMRVALVCAAEGLAATGAYTAFLRNLEVTAAARGPVAGGSLADVPVRVGPAPEGGGSAAQGFESNVSEGVVTVPITASGDDVYAFLAHAGPACAASRQRMHAATQRANEAGTATRRLLRMRHLLCGDGVLPDEFHAACARLVAARQQLAPLVEGLPMRFVVAGSRLGLSADSQYLEVPVDFALHRQRAE